MLLELLIDSLRFINIKGSFKLQSKGLYTDVYKHCCAAEMIRHLNTCYVSRVICYSKSGTAGVIHSIVTQKKSCEKKSNLENATYGEYWKHNGIAYIFEMPLIDSKNHGHANRNDGRIETKCNNVVVPMICKHNCL